MQNAFANLGRQNQRQSLTLNHPRMVPQLELQMGRPNMAELQAIVLLRTLVSLSSNDI